MKKLDSNSLFEIFSQGDEEIYRENKLEEVLDNSFILFGMVVRGVENYFIIDQLYTNRYGKQYERIRESVRLKYLLGLMRYLERIERIPSDTLHILQDEFGLQAIKYALEEMLGFFEKIEYYEQCALVKKYFDLFLKKELVD